MKQQLVISAILLLLSVSFFPVAAQEDVTITSQTSEAAPGLDLIAVGELFKDSENLEEFEKALNEPEIGINNLDLDENNEIDFIRVVEQVTDDTHLIILQVPLAENEFQDVATIEIEKTGDDNYNMQVHGNEVIYGVNYYVVPARVRIHTWPIMTRIFRPGYRPYRSVFYFGSYPRWWRPYRPVTFNVYHTRTVKFTNRAFFSVTKTTRVKSVPKLKYKPRSSTLVIKKTKVIKAPPQRKKAPPAKKGVRKKTTKKVVKPPKRR